MTTLARPAARRTLPPLRVPDSLLPWLTVLGVDPVATDTARSFGFSRTQRLFRVTLPSAVPYIATGLRIASAVSLILTVTAELVIGSPGLGRSINVARSGGDV